MAALSAMKECPKKFFSGGGWGGEKEKE